MSSAVYVVNLDELTGISVNAAVDLSEVVNLIAELKEEVKKPSGTQQAKGLTLDVPATIGDYTLTYTANTDLLLTAVTYAQTGYKSGDNWDLKVNGITVFESIYTKEMPEKKSFQKYYPVPQGNTVEIILHNVSGNSRQVFADIEYITLI